MTSDYAPSPRIYRPWSSPLPNARWNVAAGATVVQTVPLNESTRALSLALVPLANVSAVTITGTGSRIQYATFSVAPLSGILFVPVVPVLDSSVDISITAVGGGPVRAQADSLDEAGVTQAQIGAPGEDVTLGGVTAPAPLNSDAVADPTTYAIGAFTHYRASSFWRRWESPATVGLSGTSTDNVPPTAPYLFNGATLDAQRGVVDLGALITAAGATTTQISADQTNFNGRGVKVRVNTTVIGTGSITLHVQGKDSVGGLYYDLLVGAAVVTNVLNVYEVYPGVTVTANVSASTTVPRIWRVQTVANNANAATYTVAADVIP